MRIRKEKQGTSEEQKVKEEKEQYIRREARTKTRQMLQISNKIGEINTQDGKK